ncbi:hypothetical protein ZWY2020_027889 [Hordeum vulgare]|nr:hypothetical protein ZWY2020_027889 [Hordeum vulgare]
MGSFNSTALTVAFSHRAARAAPPTLEGASAAPRRPPRTILLLRGGCRGRSHAGRRPGVACRLPRSRLFNGRRHNDTSTDVACVASAAPNATVVRAVSLFWEKVEEQKCDHVLTSAVFMDTAEGTEFYTAELAQGVHSRDAFDVETPSGLSGYRCVCMTGFYGDGYAAGHGCDIGKHYKLLLAHELMHNGSLDTHLYRSDYVFTWPVSAGRRFGTSVPAQDTEQRVVHRDIKPSNILLDTSFTAKRGDFGLARLINDGRRSHTIGIAGTMGYIDPESVLAGTASVESDVYSFGVVLLEVASGQRPALVQEEGDVIHLVQWVWSCMAEV